MSELKAIIEIVDAFQTPLEAVMAWLLWRIYQNHLPHIQDRLGKIDVRLSHLEGVKEAVELEILRKL